MKAPLSWLKDYVDINVPADVLADKLVKAGFEIEEVIRPSDDYVNICAATILDMKKHPNADKLQICSVDVGKEKLQIVTAATNVSVGDTVALALDGARLPDGKTIKSGELRGVLSQGMFCGGSELKLTANDYPQAGIDGVFIFPAGVKAGTDINEFLGTNDIVFDVAVTANRPDCNSIIGIAREIAAVLNTPLKDTFAMPSVAEEGKTSDEVSVKVLDNELCPRYLAKALKNVKIAPSCELIKQRLRLVGLRPINNIVDITNYVLFDIGQPMHAFDYREIEGKEIIVRRASAGEKLVTLDGTENTLDNSNLVIANKVQPMAVAGIMGGQQSGISDTTTEVVFEFARFKRDNIRKSSRRLGLRSDSSARFEKGIDFISQDLALKRTVQLVAQQGAGTFACGVVDTLEKSACVPQLLKVSKAKIDEILGIDIPLDKMCDILRSLQFEVKAEGNVMNITVPLFREDIVGANDIAEEIIRLYGYDNIVGAPLDGKKLTQGGRTKADATVQKVKAYLSGYQGAHETFSYSFISPKFMDEFRLSEGDVRRNVIRILNPLSEDVSVMRTMLAPSALAIAVGNYSRGIKSARLYEVGKTYFPKSLPMNDTAIETETLIITAYGDDDFYSLKNVFESLCAKFNIKATFAASDEPYLHPFRQAWVSLNGEKVGVIGQVLPSILKPYKFDAEMYVCEINLSAFIDFAADYLPYVPVSKFPSVERDLALVVDAEVNGGDMLDLINKCGGEYLRNAEIFDVYSGKGVEEGKKSVAFNMLFRKTEGTLDTAEVNETVDVILQEMEKRFGAKLRA